MSQYENYFVDIQGYEGFYKINRIGQVLNCLNNKILKNNLKKNNGYYRVNLNKLKTIKTYRLHRLLAIAFIPNPQKLNEVNHINGIKTDNRICNLEWVNHLQNVQHAYKTGLIDIEKRKSNAKKIGMSNRKISFKTANLIRELYYSKKYNQRELSKMFNTCFQNISLIIKNKTQLEELI